MHSLFTYCIPVDDGAASNPFWGVCTLAICKPKIRLKAEVGDWVVGTGSRNAPPPVRDCSGCVVYAMRVTRKMTMCEYDYYTRRSLPEKIPIWDSPDVRRRVGDSIYDFSTWPPNVRPSVHSEANRQHDLGGKSVLLSDHFFCFGDKPLRLPDHLLPIVKQTQGHRSRANAEYVDAFVEWLHSLGYKPNTLIGQPQDRRWLGTSFRPRCAGNSLDAEPTLKASGMCKRR